MEKLLRSCGKMKEYQNWENINKFGLRLAWGGVGISGIGVMTGVTGMTSFLVNRNMNKEAMDDFRMSSKLVPLGGIMIIGGLFICSASRGRMNYLIRNFSQK